MRPREFPLILINIIHTALQASDGARFRPGSICPYCGSDLSGYDARKKRFAIILEKGEPHIVEVIIHRSYCSSCKRIVNPPEPFYPGTRIGSPVVDLCRSFSSVMPCTRASSYLARMGVQVDRWSVRHYANLTLPVMPLVDVFSMKIPVSIISLSSLAGSLPGTTPLDMDDILEVCHHPDRVPAFSLRQDQKDLENNS